jgi:hypothetical protein
MYTAPVKAQRPPRREQNTEQRFERKPQGKRPQPRKDRSGPVLQLYADQKRTHSLIQKYELNHLDVHQYQRSTRRIS